MISDLKKKVSKQHSNHFIDAVVKQRPALVRQAQKFFRNVQHAEDAAQDALVSALSHADQFRGDCQISTWLYRVGANSALMKLRKMKRAQLANAKQALLAVTDKSSWIHGSVEESPHQSIEGSERRQILLEAVEKLPKHYKDVVLLCDLDEKPIEQVAASLGLTIGGVRTRRLRAHRLLKDSLLHARL